MNKKRRKTLNVWGILSVSACIYSSVEDSMLRQAGNKTSIQNVKASQRLSISDSVTQYCVKIMDYNINFYVFIHPRFLVL